MDNEEKNGIVQLLKSKGWQRVLQHLNKELEYLNNKLTNCPLEEIGEIRGEIKAIKKLIDTLDAWAKEANK